MFCSQIQGAKRLLWMISIHRQQKAVVETKSSLDEVLAWLRANGVVIPPATVRYENHGTYNQLHVHAFAWVLPTFRWSPFNSYGEVHEDNSIMTHRIYWKPVKDVGGALSYLNKQVRNKYEQERILLENYAKHTYMFLPEGPEDITSPPEMCSQNNANST